MSDATPEKSSWVIEASQATFQQDVFERSMDLPVVVDFWAAWCQPCRLLGPILEGLADEYDGKFLLVKADTDQVPEAAAQFGVQSIPAVYGLRDGKVIDFFVGALPEEQIRAWLDRLLPTPAEVLVAEAVVLKAADPQAAETKFKEALGHDEHHAPAKIGLAWLLLERDRIEEAAELVADLERRGFLEPEAEKVKAAVDRRLQGRDAGGVQQCRQAAADRPDDLGLQLKLVEALAAEEQYEEALEIGLSLVQKDKQGTGQTARQIMVDIFRLLPDDSELTSTYRRKLSFALY